MRELKHHEKKLLRKVSLYSWKGDTNVRQASILRRYHIQDRQDYIAYEKICGHVTSLCAKLKTLPADDEFRIQMSDQCLTKLFDLGIIDSTSNLEKAETISISMFCRRRLPLIMVRNKMSQTTKEAITLIEQGHIRVGPNVVTDPAFLVNRKMEDFTTWVDRSKVLATVLRYNNKLDDFDLGEN